MARIPTLLAAAMLISCAAVAAPTTPPDTEFTALDSNADGYLSHDEHAQASARLFASMDGNKDGKVTAAEISAAHDKATGTMAKKGEPSSADKIKAIDGDGDGVLSAAEHATGAAAMFKAMDVIGDGRISRAEMASARLRIQEAQAALRR